MIDRLNILVAGVGGQGTVLASKLLAQAALLKGLPVRTAETIGMAQRGGSVFGHVRIGPGNSPLISKGGADILIGFEPTETLRALPYLKPGGTVATALHPIDPPQLAQSVGQGDRALIPLPEDARERKAVREVGRDALSPCPTTPTTSSNPRHPDRSAQREAEGSSQADGGANGGRPDTSAQESPLSPLDHLRAAAASPAAATNPTPVSAAATTPTARIGTLIEVDGDALCARLGSSRVLNVALIGAALSTQPPLLDIETLTAALDLLVKEHYRTLNHQALKAGVEHAWR